MEKIDKYCDDLNRKYRNEKIRKIMAVIGLCIGTLVAGYFVGHKTAPKTVTAPMAVALPITVKKYIDFSFEIVGDGSTVTKIKNKMSGTEYRITLAGDSPWCYISEEILSTHVNSVDSLIVIDGKFNEDNEYFFDYFRSLITQDEIGTDHGTPTDRQRQELSNAK